MIRRDFIKSSAFAAGALVAPYPLYSQDQKIKLAILGTGWWGTDYLLGYALISKQFEIVALCDVNAVSLQNAANRVVESGNKKPKLFSSYQEMLKLETLKATVMLSI